MSWISGKLPVKYLASTTIYQRCFLGKFAGVWRYSTIGQQNPLEKQPEYKVVYRFPYIVPTRVVTRFKIYQTLLTCVAAPSTYIAAQHGHLAPELASSCILASLLALGTLYYISFITRRLIGLVSIHESNERVKLAHMTFWGSRNDIIVPVDDIVPLSESSISSKDLYTDVKTYDDKVKLFISLRYGGIKDIESFEKIFGRIK